MDGVRVQPCADAGGYIGPVVFGVSAARYTSFGTVTPARATLAPGQSVAVQVRTHTPAQPGDASGAIVVRSSPARGGSTTSTTVPVTLRSLIPPGNQTFSGTVTGGNGRAPISGQEFFYQLDVPAGQPELNATVTIQDPGNQFGAYLIDPQGEAVAYATNMAPGATPILTARQPGRRPAAHAQPGSGPMEAGGGVRPRGVGKLALLAVPGQHQRTGGAGIKRRATERRVHAATAGQPRPTRSR